MEKIYGIKFSAIVRLLQNVFNEFAGLFYFHCFANFIGNVVSHTANYFNTENIYYREKE